MKVLHHHPVHKIYLYESQMRSGFNPRRRKKNFSSNFCVQSGSEAHQASCTMGTGGPFPGVWPGRDADHSPSSSAEVKNE
jgi:hypothetical protein